MKKTILLFVVALCGLACQNTQSEPEKAPAYELSVASLPAEYNDLTLHPIVATTGFLNQNQRAVNFTTLDKALEQEKFRITEKKPFGREQTEGVINKLTIQNKTTDSVFLMQGEIVRGGLQDRVIAQNMIVHPHTIRDISVFCVEKDRWQQQADNSLNKADKDIFAFRGYYHIAAGSLRKNIKKGDQQAVWESISKMRNANAVEAESNTIASLESSEAFTRKRNDYLTHLRNGFAMDENVVGVIARQGDQVIGIDLFGQPAIFQSQYEALLHSYITEVLSANEETTQTARQLTAEDLTQLLQRRLQVATEKELFRYEGTLIYFSDF